MEKSKLPVGWAETISKIKVMRTRNPLLTTLLALWPVFSLLFEWLGLCHCSAPSTTTTTITCQCCLSRYLFISFTQHFTVSLIKAELHKACFIASTTPAICHHAYIYSWINTEGRQGREKRPRVLFYQVWGVNPTIFISHIHMLLP